MTELTVILVLTRSPFSEAARAFFRLLDSVARQASEVRVYLFYDGVLAAKEGSQTEGNLSEFAQKGVEVIVDGREFKARGLGETAAGVKTLEHPVPQLVDDIMAENSRVIVV